MLPTCKDAARLPNSTGLSGQSAALIDLVLDSVAAAHTKRAYRRCLLQFFQRLQQAEDYQALNRRTVQQYRVFLEAMGKSTSTVNQALAAIRTLAREAAEHGLLGAVEACGIERIHGLRSLGRRTGTWLSAASARALLSLPDKNSMQGKRDRCLLALEVGAGVRRAAWSGIQVGQLKRLDDRWVIADMKGKQNKAGTVPLSSWVYDATRVWIEAAGHQSGKLLRPVNQAGRVTYRRLSASAIYQIVRGYGVDLHMHLAPHDLRRSCAKLAKKGGAPLDQIQVTLGHESIRATELYFGLDLDLANPACDFIKLDDAESW